MKNIIVLFSLFLSITISAQRKKDYVVLESKDLRIDKVDNFVNNCLKTDEGVTTLGMKGCYLEGILKMDSILNIVYKQTLKMLKKDDQERFKISQRKWLQFYQSEIGLTNEVFRSWANESKYGYGSQINVTEVFMNYTLIRERVNRMAFYLVAE
jgi:uncharacterized protein YecT (DUF1311 family)